MIVLQKPVRPATKEVPAGASFYFFVREKIIRLLCFLSRGIYYMYIQYVYTIEGRECQKAKDALPSKTSLGTPSTHGR